MKLISHSTSVRETKKQQKNTTQKTRIYRLVNKKIQKALNVNRQQIIYPSTAKLMTTRKHTHTHTHTQPNKNKKRVTKKQIK